MSTMIPKSQMTEEDIKLNYITPALMNRGWQNRITMETRVQFTDGKVNLRGNLASREPGKKADYVLYINANNPIAIVEAKDNHHSASAGLQQAMTYARMMKLPFAYSSNGDAFYEHDFLTGTEREIPLDAFPTHAELYERYKAKANDGEGLSEEEEKIIGTPYYTGQNTNSPRYYQRNAINRTVEAIARGQKRLLLVMATGTGKTYTAFQIVYRLLKAGMKRKILYLADRNILVDQSIQQDFSPLERTIHKINFAKDNPSTVTSYEVYFSLYQQLSDRESEQDEENIVSRLSTLFRPDFFDLVIVDECHRGSAKKDSNWRKILEYFKDATQIGMTATPKETTYISNIDYFGDPIYTYSLREGIDDGFLAPFRVINIKTDISDGWRPLNGQLDRDGNPIPDRVYENRDFDYNIVIEDRIQQVAKEITRYLKSTDRMQKTIVFCATEEHAERMRIALTNLNKDKTAENPDYVVRITGSDEYGKSKLDYFIAVDTKYPVIATTSKLLSTGVDCKMTKLIVLDQWITSMTDFKQIIGRGTRLREADGKTWFTVMDFRNITRMFNDPEWDGPIEQHPGYGNGPDDPPFHTPPETPPTPIAERFVPFVDRDGCRVTVINKTVSVYDSNGRLLRQENIIDYTKKNILGSYATLENFIRRWSDADKKQAIQELFRDRGIDLDAMKKDEHMDDVDDFDFICHVAYDQKPLTRRERAEGVKKRDFLSRYSGPAREVLEALLDKYMNSGIYELESTEILKLDPLKRYGAPSRIVSLFGGKAGYMEAIKGLEEELYRTA